ncbi:MAG: hypothetical protein K6U74_15545, partial [Firmicutes bacterium]|nr:hypothetical protein [Bacillota bacterium]
PRGGAVYVVCPSRPALAGEIAAGLSKKVKNSALVCAAGDSTAAIALGMMPEELILRDWRIPGSDAPVTFNGVTCWPVDPAKFLDYKEVPVNKLVSQVSRKFNMTLVDCGNNLSLCINLPRDGLVIAVRSRRDLSEQVLDHWMRQTNCKVLDIVDTERLTVIEVDKGFVLQTG